MRLPALLVPILGFVFASSLPVGAAELVVVAVRPGSAAERAGLAPGDRLSSWEQPLQPEVEAARGELGSPFDVLELEAERAPRGPVTLVGRRGSRPLAVSLFPDDWGLDTRPELPGALEARFAEARRCVGAGDIDTGVAGLRGLLDELRSTSEPPAVAWIWFEIAQAEAKRRVPTEAAASALREAIAATGPDGPPNVRALIWLALGRICEKVCQDEALKSYQEVRVIREAEAPDSVARAAVAASIALLARSRGSGVAEARPDLVAATARLERLAPRSLALVRSLRALGWLAESGAEARELFAKALGLAEVLSPDGRDVALVLHGLATFTSEKEGLLELRQRVVRIQERLDPEGRDLASAYSVLAAAQHDLGDLAGAQQSHRRSLALVERSAPQTTYHAATLHNFARFCQMQGNLAQAENLYRQALGVTERLMPTGERRALVHYGIASVLDERRDFEQATTHLERVLENLDEEGKRTPLYGYALKMLAREQGDVDAAAEYLRRALELFTAVDDVPQQAATLGEMGRLQIKRGGLDEAAATLSRATALLEAQYSSSTILGDLYASTADLDLRRGDLPAAEGHYRAALDLAALLSPGSAQEAVAANGLGDVLRQRGRAQDALALYRRAVEALEIQSRFLGGSEEVRGAYRAHYQHLYRDLEELLLELGYPEDAFGAFERSRSRGLLLLLAGRDLNLRDAPLELEQERRRANMSHDRLLQQTSASGLSDTRRAKLRAQLSEARRVQEDLRSRLRTESPRLAALRDPEPLDLAGVRRVIGPGTLLLGFSLGARSGRVYAVGPGLEEFSVHSVPLGEDDLRMEVERFRALIEQRRSPQLLRGVQAQGQKLSRLLLGPVAERISLAERLLIVPDGSLHLLPFAALRDPASAGSERYLIQAKPLHVVSSVTLYEALTRERSSPVRQTGVVGFGDPSYPDAAERSLERSGLRTSLTNELKLGRLSRTRGELAALRVLAPGNVQLWLGSEATEERAKALDPATRIAHFACHGILDEEFPLESGLALTPPGAGTEGKDNGLLQAWEVFESLRLDAELVTLSACRTAIGRELAGEGLLGLTWAFQYAGAKSVLASLWEVDDAATAELMGRFYRHLGAGQTKADALRAAQCELMQRPSTRAPFFWAAFELIGDWR